MSHARVMDIGGSELSLDLRTRLINEIVRPINGVRSLPTEIFYDTDGLELWSRIVGTEHYTQLREEAYLLSANANALADVVREGVALLDMGSGDLRKIVPLLDHLEASRISVDYYALELSEEHLERSLARYTGDYHYVTCHGLWGTFADGMAWVLQLQQPVCILSLGSMLGNDRFELSIERLRPWANTMRHRFQTMGFRDHLLLGMDACQNTFNVRNSYHDPEGLWNEFIVRGLEKSNAILDHKWFRETEWKVSGLIRLNPVMHAFTVEAIIDVDCPSLGLTIPSGETVEFFEAWKYCPDSMLEQFTRAGFTELATWICSHAPFCTYSTVIMSV